MSEVIENYTIDEIKQEIIKFNNDENITKLFNFYNKKSIFDIMGISRRELSHSYFFYWLLNPNESHGLNEFPLRKLFEILFLSKFWSSYENRIASDEILAGNYRITSSNVYREYNLGIRGRVDLVVEITNSYDERVDEKIRFIIENKVLSSEGQDQTNRYFEYFSELKDEFRNIFIFLTPISTLDLEELTSPRCDNENFIQINYQSVLDIMLEPALQQNLSSETKYFIEQYIQTLSQPTYKDDDEDYERGLIMAIRTNGRHVP